MTAKTFTARDGRKIVLRPLREPDIEPLFLFASKIAREKKRNPELGIVSLDRPVTRADERKFLAKTLKGSKDGDVVSVAAFAGQALVGNCDITRRPFRDELHTGVLGIVIVEDYRGIGLGGALIREALASAKVKGIWLVELEVFSINESARRLYRRLGFKEFGVLPEKVIRGGRRIDSVYMFARLDGNRYNAGRPSKSRWCSRS